MKVIFLDRDGVINQYPGDFKYVTSWEEFHFLPNTLPALKKIADNGFKIFIISNQAGVSKGIFTQNSLNLITKNMLKEINKYQVKIDGVYYCIHRTEDNCSCRKPKTGLVDMVMEKIKEDDQNIELFNSYFIGDTIRDIETGKKAGLRTMLLFSGKERPENKNTWEFFPDFTAQDLSEAADIVTNSI